MKKATLILALSLIVSVVPVFSFGIGAAFGVDGALGVDGTVGPGALLSFRLDSYPAVFGLGFSTGGGSFSLGATADWWLYNASLISILSLYVGPGVYLDLNIYDGNVAFGAGVRVPVGLQAWIIEPLELFFEVAPTFGLKNGDFPAFGVQGAVGFRFWF